MATCSLPWRVMARRLLPAALLCTLGLSARATIDMAMNTTNFVAGQASTLSVDGVITPGGTSTSITATHLTIRFDPAKLTLSTFQPAGNWSLLGTNTDALSAGEFQAVLVNTTGPLGEGQTETGPLLTSGRRRPTPTLTPATAPP